MDITLYKFNKKANSTAVPGSSVESITVICQVKTPSSIISPVVQLSKGTDPIDYNYAYIKEWKRYYFISDITYSLGVWVLDLRVDVLASFRSQIKASSQYVIRSASSSDGNIVDNFYPTKGNSTKGKTYGSVANINGTTPVPTYFDGILFTGCYVVQVYSNNNSAITAYAMNQTAFNSLLTNLMNYVPSDMSDVSSGVAKQLFDPLQYIVSVQWFPNFPDKGTGAAASSISFGGYSIGVSGTCNIIDPTAWDWVYSDITVAKHPDVTSFPYMQLSPYSNYRLYFEPFGTIPLDTTRLYGVSEIRCGWFVDYQKGMVHLEVTDKADSSNVIATSDSVLGVDIPIAQLTSDYLGVGSSIVSGTGRVLEDLITGNIFGAAGDFISSIGSGVMSMIPNVSGKGTPGSFLIFRGEQPRIEYQFMNIVERDNNRYGSPLCQSVVLSDLSGFTVCSQASMQTSGTAAESEQIESYLNTGVYLE